MHTTRVEHLLQNPRPTLCSNPQDEFRWPYCFGLQAQKTVKHNASLREDDAGAAPADTYTHKNIQKKREEPETSASVNMDTAPFDFDLHDDMSAVDPAPPRSKGKTQRDYVVEFVNRVDEMLQGLLSRETLPKDRRLCRHCSENNGLSGGVLTALSLLLLAVNAKNGSWDRFDSADPTIFGDGEDDFQGQEDHDEILEFEPYLPSRSAGTSHGSDPTQSADTPGYAGTGTDTRTLPPMKTHFCCRWNFKADHVRQKSVQDDVWLLDGAGMAPNRAEYLQFLRTAIERLTKAPCENTFRAIMNALLASKACDITGLVALVCARHGCYVPNALVDLFKGEQQKNVDFAFLKALESTRVDPQQGVMLIYDIACQYSVHLHDRIGHLLPVGLQVDRAIDHFHVHAHKDECYFRYATTFIPGAGIVKGQILESLCNTMLAVPRCKGDGGANGHILRGTVDTLDSQTMNTWENEVLGVEAMRLANVKAMDVYAARVPDRQEQTSDRHRHHRHHPYNNGLSSHLIDIQDKVRRLGSVPREDEVHIIEQLREALAPLLVKLKELKEAAEIPDKHPEIP
ncbi:hypothetical protein BDZ97DRAFT_1933981 [Flammula alnicola]|nr:hypothetical protein BDZ97DRAFT_1933981 [Flammula alnicola]